MESLRCGLLHIWRDPPTARSTATTYAVRALVRPGREDQRARPLHTPTRTRIEHLPAAEYARSFAGGGLIVLTSDWRTRGTLSLGVESLGFGQPMESHASCKGGSRCGSRAGSGSMRQGRENLYYTALLLWQSMSFGALTTWRSGIGRRHLAEFLEVRPRVSHTGERRCGNRSVWRRPRRVAPVSGFRSSSHSPAHLRVST